MLLFNSFISQVGLVEIPLQGRRFTWSNKRPNPTLSKIDRVFFSHDWLNLPANFSLIDLPATTSDHAPLLLSLKPISSTCKRSFKLESFWLRATDFDSVVAHSWTQAPSAHDPAENLIGKLRFVAKSLTLWASVKFASYNVNLRRTKLVIRFLDLSEESRQLSIDEFLLRIALREHAFSLTQIQEEKWKQHSGATWLKLGDKNTRYFHAVATKRLVGNTINSVSLPNRHVNLQGELTEVFLSHFKNLLGTPPTQSPPFDLTGKVGPRFDLTALDEPFTEAEILRAVREIPSGKATGPDGYPIEFFKRAWETIKGDVLPAFMAFQDGTLNLRKLNKASITLVPKKRNPMEISDYRPISVINTFSKIISKILANRLQPHMTTLVSPLQTAFTKGRSIMESYMVAREFLSFYHKNKIPALLLKVDFAKAFDSVSWTFLTNLLVERGFPPRWLTWVLRLLTSSSSSIKINGESTETFFHRKGLRQGDPLSPLLFILAVDALQSFISNAAPLLTGQVIIPPRALQYADDTIILMEANPRNLLVVKDILTHFASVSGLKINDSKCLFVPIQIPVASLPAFSQILGCAPVNLSVTYLGLPLSIRRPRKLHFKPLLDAFQRKLDSWQSKFLSLGGRLTLVKSVLTALPLHYMQVIKLPPWLIKHLDGIRRGFFWKGAGKCLGGHCLVNWAKCCLPKKCGGLGIMNLSIQNQALLMKWLWKLQKEPDSIWASTVNLLYGTRDIATLLADGSTSVAFRDILHFNDFFSSSIYNPGLPQRLTWKWSTTGDYSAASAYRLLADPGMRSPYHKLLWKIKAPPKVQIFLWLILLDRVLTQQNLVRRNWPSITSCQCCSEGCMETSVHLFVHCNFAKQIWTQLQIRFNLPLLTFTTDLPAFWLQNRETIGPSWDIIWAASSWAIWKERNSRIFGSNRLTAMRLLVEICATIEVWKKMA
ncbi:hypothetical protein LUZ63_019541 [Rhynchospora breviuscula]|uniref:Reverse transcriptase domain-containing protein n=1 Tax=Rhynchospora breviuscula TaxID=2022672 RepID=A0A9Q0HJ68_9POAL|nr:hypothetical protein LUZ63_019541 [Rhynchospora breviuscula]